MNRETSRTGRRIAPERRLRRIRSSGRREGRVKVGHDKMGRPKYRPEGTMAIRRGLAHFYESQPGPGRWEGLTALRRGEHAQHVQRGMAMGLTRKQAERHARSDERDGLADARRVRRAAHARTGASI